MTQDALKPVSPPCGADYQRVDCAHLPRQGPGADGAGRPVTTRTGGNVRWAVIPLSALLCALQAVATILASNISEIFFTSTLIPIVGFGLVFLIVLAVNPVLRLAAAVMGRWARPLNRAELICVFTAMLVTAGISTFGLTEYLVPLVAAPNNHEQGWNTPTTGWDESLVPRLNPKLYIQDSNAIDLFRHGVKLTDPSGKPIFPPHDFAPWSEKISYDWRVCQAIPWKVWIAPLAYWMLFIAACYALFYSLTYIVLSYWAEREKLIFPLARLCESILPEPGGEGPSGAGDGDGGGGGWGRYRIPTMLRVPGFWIGFAISFTVLTWNALFDTSFGLIKGMGLWPITLGMHSDVAISVFAGTIFEGLTTSGTDQTLMFLVVFAAIGIAFLLPLEISFSVWFYFVMGQLFMLALMWSGHGRNIADYPSDFLWQSNPLTALGGGGIYLFSGICLFRCVRDYVRTSSGKTLGRRLMMGAPVVGLVGCIAVVVCWLNWNHLPIGWAIVFVVCFTLLTIGLMRIMAEAGMYWFQADTGFFHLYKILGLGSFLAPALVATLLPIYSVLFMDMKTFLALNLPNAAEMQRHSHVNKLKFHLNLAICIALSVAVSLFTAIYLAHLRGAASMEQWFYQSSAPLILNSAQHILTAHPAFEPNYAFCYLAGAVWVGLSFYLRTTFFWFPHPVGFIMLIDPLIDHLWFSFFLGWVCKWVAVHYGGKKTYDRVRSIFIGLIAGELVAVLFWTCVALRLGTTVSMRKIGGQDR